MTENHQKMTTEQATKIYIEVSEAYDTAVSLLESFAGDEESEMRKLNIDNIKHIILNLNMIMAHLSAFISGDDRRKES